MANKITYTGKIGPGNTVTSLVFNNVTSAVFNYEKQTLDITFSNNPNGIQMTRSVTLAGVTTITHSISGTTYTITVS